LHIKVARKCVQLKKHFLNASYLTPDIQSLDEEARSSGITILVEMGLDPGIDHMSAMEMIHDIRKQGGRIFMFRSHCGGLISPESDNNPWRYKISWNPRNIILAGKDGANYLSNSQICHVQYGELFDAERTVEVPGFGKWAWYPNRDSLPYIGKYALQGVEDFVRTTLRHPDFAAGWSKLVSLGLTDETTRSNTNGVSVKDYFRPYLLGMDNWSPLEQEQFRFLELERDDLLNMGVVSPADVLQSIVEKKLALAANDKDMIIMLHEIGYYDDDSFGEASAEERIGGSQLAKRVVYKKASLVVKGEDAVHTAMAKTVGLPLAIAVRNILNGKITRRGVSIPVHPEIYEIVLRDLEKKGIVFTITEEANA
ncbi:MAG TPA: saccharopine dehydrogenase C-terminal domain-containing protein, partial [Chitinophagaceae bacterium]|nr:saccharopine dehydrogenase C-terminal domain-containing protein [Chitinophagaceae bacterium]